jgi:hypothetical protein
MGMKCCLRKARIPRLTILMLILEYPPGYGTSGAKVTKKAYFFGEICYTKRTLYSALLPGVDCLL